MFFISINAFIPGQKWWGFLVCFTPVVPEGTAHSFVGGLVMNLFCGTFPVCEGPTLECLLSSWTVFFFVVCFVLAIFFCSCVWINQNKHVSPGSGLYLFIHFQFPFLITFKKIVWFSNALITYLLPVFAGHPQYLFHYLRHLFQMGFLHLSRDGVLWHCLTTDWTSHYFGFHATTNIHSFFWYISVFNIFQYKIIPNESN